MFRDDLYALLREAGRGDGEIRGAAGAADFRRPPGTSRLRHSAQARKPGGPGDNPPPSLEKTRPAAAGPQARHVAELEDQAAGKPVPRPSAGPGRWLTYTSSPSAACRHLYVALGIGPRRAIAWT